MEFSGQSPVDFRPAPGWVRGCGVLGEGLWVGVGGSLACWLGGWRMRLYLCLFVSSPCCFKPRSQGTGPQLMVQPARPSEWTERREHAEWFGDVVPSTGPTGVVREVRIAFIITMLLFYIAH